MNENPYLQSILTEVEAVGKDWDALLSGKFRLREIYDLVGSLVRAAEAVITAPQSGPVKHQLVRDAFVYFDQKYHIIDRIDDLVALPFWAEPFDGPFLRRMIDFLIGQAVSTFNATIWEKEDASPEPDAVPVSHLKWRNNCLNIRLKIAKNFVERV